MSLHIDMSQTIMQEGKLTWQERRCWWKIVESTIRAFSKGLSGVKGLIQLQARIGSQTASRLKSIYQELLHTTSVTPVAVQRQYQMQRQVDMGCREKAKRYSGTTVLDRALHIIPSTEEVFNYGLGIALRDAFWPCSIVRHMMSTGVEKGENTGEGSVTSLLLGTAISWRYKNKQCMGGLWLWTACPELGKHVWTCNPFRRSNCGVAFLLLEMI